MRKILLFALLTVSAPALAHSGGTDAYGCHTNHATGVYHCHSRAKPEAVQKVAKATLPAKPAKVAVR
jgi:hypothetical protein